MDYFYDNIAKPKVDPLSGLELYYTAAIGETKAMVLNVEVGKRGHFLLYHKVHVIAGGLLSLGRRREEELREWKEYEEEKKKGISKQEVMDILYRLEHSKRKPNPLPFEKAYLSRLKKMQPILRMSKSIQVEDKVLRVQLARKEKMEKDDDLNEEEPPEENQR